MDVEYTSNHENHLDDPLFNGLDLDEFSVDNFFEDLPTLSLEDIHELEVPISWWNYNDIGDLEVPQKEDVESFDVSACFLGNRKRRRTKSNSKKRRDYFALKNYGVKKRVCSHCQAEKTPQWREGPLGPRSLCNACGVRYKSGRLVPEYRPAASPSFDSFKHSNFHKKILKRKMDTAKT